jgi:hypothetical protein
VEVCNRIEEVTGRIRRNGREKVTRGRRNNAREKRGEVMGSRQSCARRINMSFVLFVFFTKHMNVRVQNDHEKEMTSNT